MKHGSLFSGVGGFDLASEWMGWENVFHCEWNEFGQRILKHYWPGAISYADITKTDFTIHRGSIDILTGGFPCQPYSVAGKRKGTEDDRHLWPEMLRAIREIQPAWIVGENVRGLINWDGGMVFEQVQSEMETEGYEVQPILLPAASVNAPHERYRIWFVAHRIGISGKYGQYREVRCQESARQSKRDKRKRLRGQLGGISQTGNASNSISIGFGQGASEGIHSEKQEAIGSNFNNLCGKGAINRADWEKFPTVSPVCNGNDGLSSQMDGITFSKWRAESIKGGGNAIVPQLAYQIFKAIENS